MIDIICLISSFIPFLCSIPFCISTVCGGICAIGGWIGAFVSVYVGILGGIYLLALGIVLWCIAVPIFVITIVGIPMAIVVGIGGILLCLVGLVAIGAGAIGLIASLCCLAVGGITTVCSLICVILLCPFYLTFMGCCAVEGIISLGAICVFPFTLPCCYLACCPLTCWFGIPLYVCVLSPWYCVFCPCCFEIPWLVRYCLFLISCGVCNLIDFWILGIITLNCTIGEIVALGGWLCCPCCVCLPCLPFGFSGLMLQTKLAYLCCSFPYTCWCEPFYVCATGILLMGWAVEIFCVPFAMCLFSPLACLISLMYPCIFSITCVAGWGICGVCSLSGFGSLIMASCLTACSGLGVAYCCFCSSCLTCPSCSGLGLTCLGLGEKFGGFSFKGLFTVLGLGEGAISLGACLNGCILDGWNIINSVLAGLGLIPLA